MGDRNDEAFVSGSDDRAHGGEDLSENIAIVGMAGRFPGALDVFEFWENLRDGIESIRDFTVEELRAAGVEEASIQSPGYVSAGAVMDGADGFDAAFFGVSKREAEIMDPQHRVFLESAWTALEHAGYDPENYHGDIGVFGGVAPNTYLQNVLLTRPDIVRMTGRYPLLVGSEREYAITRTAFKLNLTGPAISVNTACSTSGVALHLACQSVLSGECDMALVGGARIKAPLTAGYHYEEDGILSPDGRCRAFDAEARGTVIGSGVAMVVIKRLSEALRDGDTVHAVILGTAVNNDGARKVGFTAPGVEGQAAVITEALEMAGIDAESVSYVEAHGTATFLGDPIEIAALTKAFRSETDPTAACAIGSVKTNIGHLDAGAGMAGVIKTVLALEAQQLPPSLNFTRPNPQIDFASSPFYVNDTLSDWPSSGSPRRAGVSSFGLGGTNAHVILEEAPPQEPGSSSRRHHLLVLSAKTESALTQAVSGLANHLGAHPGLELPDVAHTLQVGRRHFEHRQFLVASDLEDAIEALDGQDSQSVFAGDAEPGERPVVFMFPGGGAQYVGMGRDLFDTEPVYRAAFQRCAQLVSSRSDTNLIDVVYPHDAAGDGEPLDRPAIALPALFAVEYATAQLLMARGIQPDMMIGHSLGEYTAACLSGVLSLADALALVAVRGELFETLPPGGMLSVPLPEREVGEILGSDLAIAVVNKPALCIVSGKTDDIESFANMLAERGVDSRELHIAVAAHSHHVEPILDEFVAFARTIEFAAPKIPFASNTSGKWITPEEATDPEYWGRHLRSTVRFVDGLATVLDGPDRILVEVGPGQTLSGFARQHPARSDGQMTIATMRHPTENASDDAFFLKSLGRLWLAGASVGFSLYDGERRRRVPLPGYPFERKRYWIEPGVPAGMAPPPVAPAESLSAAPLPEEPAAQDTGTSSDDRKSRILTEVKSIFHELSGIEVYELDPYATFLELGFDSLFMTQATSALGSTLGVRVSFRQLFEEAPTLDALAAHLDERLPAEAFPPPAPVFAIPASNATAGVPPAIDATVPVGAAAPDGIEQLIEQQLEIMRQQLAALQGAATPSAEAAPSAATVEPAPGAQPGAAVGKRGESSLEPTGPWRPVSRQREELNAEQRAHIDGLVERLTTRSPGSKRITQENRERLADPRTVAGFRLPWKELVYPVVADRSAGSKVWDVDGNEYLDVAMGFGVNLFGHSPEFIIDAVAEQLGRGIEIGPQTPLAGEVAGLISELTGHERVAFSNTGSEAVLAAMRLARTVTGRTKVVTFANDYHGLFDEVLARGITIGSERRSVPIAPGIPAHMSQELVILDYGDPESLEVIADLGSQLAAVLVEPVQSRHPDLQPKQFLQDLRRVTADSGVPLIFDEMITGFRAHPGGVQALFDVRPDLATYGKVIGGGFPIGVVAGSGEYMDALDGGMWRFGDDSIPEADVTWFAGTFVRHPVALAAARAALLHMQEQGPSLQESLNARTAEFVRNLNGFLGDRDLPMWVETFSSLFLPKFRSQQQYASLFYFHLRDQGIHLTEGRAAFLSTAHTDGDVERLLRAFQTAVVEMSDGGFLVSEQASSARRPSEGADTGGVIEAALTDGQQEIWLASQVSPSASCAYNLANTLRLDGPLDVPTLIDAIHGLVARHEALRTTVDPNGLHQRVSATIDLEVPIVDLSTMEQAQREDRLAEIHSEAVETPFDLAAGPLLRAKLIRLGAEEHLLVLTIHHVICDGWSSGILFGDLAELYTAARQGRTPKLDPPMQLREYAEWQAEYQAGADWDDDETFWAGSIETSFPITDLPSNQPRPALKTYGAKREELHVEAEIVSRMRERAAAEGVTLFTALLGGFECYLHRLTGETEIALGISIAGQTQFPDRDLVGHCINMLPVRRFVDGSATFHEHIRSTHGAFLDAFDHQNFSYGSLLKRLTARRDPSRNPLVSIIFNMDSPSRVLEFDGATGHPGSMARHFENFDMFVNVVPVESGLTIECTYNVDLYDAATIRRRLEGFAVLLEAIATGDDRRIARLPVMSGGEKELLARWNDTAAEYPGPFVLHAAFERRAHDYPDEIALIAGEEVLTYGELNGRANRLARLLVELGVGPGVMVGIFMERSVEMVMALYAILKAGGGYVPLDPEYPRERLGFMIGEAELPVVLIQERLRDALPEADVRVVAVDSEWESIAGLPGDDLSVEVDGDDVAYVIFTSGSTGRPKGVINTHRAVHNVSMWMQDFFDLDGSDRVLQKTPFSFDVSVWEFFWPLMVGARLVLAEPGAHRDAGYLARTIVEHDITTTLFVPSMLRFFLEHGEVESCVSLRRVICIGETLTRDLQDRFFSRLDAGLFNLYGPTESAVGVSYWGCRQDDGLSVVPIGRPVSNTQIHVLDEHLQPVPVGVTGELHIGGVQVAKGYVNRPELTAELFVPDPFSNVADARLYRSGDLARFMPDGNVDFLGRADFQVKILGNRVELGEIEATLLQHAAIEHAVVVVSDSDVPGQEHLIAYVTAHDGHVDTGEVRDFLTGRLPRYMVPGRWMVVDELPTSTSGKVDRRALPVPDQAALLGGTEHVAPRTPLEEDIAAVWAEVLGVDEIGVRDDFFDLGGHSLDAMRVNTRIGEMLHVELSLGTFFEAPTVAGQALAATAAMGDQLMGAGGLEALVAEISGSDGPPNGRAR